MIRIFLVGYMGSGKTTLGKPLASKLNLGFIDMDHFIEAGYKKTIPEIFETEGESRFRELEREYLQRLFELDNIVVATGGGAPCFFDNMELINRNGTSIYLHMTVEALVSRLTQAGNTRPLLKNKTAEEIKDFIKTSLTQREPYYLRAHYRLEAMSLDANQLAGFIRSIS